MSLCLGRRVCNENANFDIVSDDIKVGVLIANTPSEIQRHLQLTKGLDSTYAEVRGVIINYCKTRQLTKVRLSNSTSDDSTDIGTFWRKTQKGRPPLPGKGRSKDLSDYQSLCYQSWHDKAKSDRRKEKKPNEKGQGRNKGFGTASKKKVKNKDHQGRSNWYNWSDWPQGKSDKEKRKKPTAKGKAKSHSCFWKHSKSWKSSWSNWFNWSDWHQCKSKRESKKLWTDHPPTNGWSSFQSSAGHTLKWRPAIGR